MFVGDLNDKGPSSSTVIDRVRAWVESGRAHAAMGNHELNALAWNTRGEDGKWLRPHTEPNRRHHEAHLREAKRNPWRYAEHLAFFRTLPLYLDLGSIRIVHACWDEPSLDAFRDLPDAPLSDQTLRRMHTPGDPLHSAVETALKGPGIKLPKALRFRDSAGKLRREARMKWWEPEGSSLADLCLLKTKPPREEWKKMKAKQPKHRVLYTSDIPVFFGHYHLTGKPRPTSQNAICTDWGAGSGRRLAAYRWNGGEVRAENFVSVRV